MCSNPKDVTFVEVTVLCNRYSVIFTIFTYHFYSLLIRGKEICDVGDGQPGDQTLLSIAPLLATSSALVMCSLAHSATCMCKRTKFIPHKILNGVCKRRTCRLNHFSLFFSEFILQPSVSCYVAMSRHLWTELCRGVCGQKANLVCCNACVYFSGVTIHCTTFVFFCGLDWSE